MKIYKGDLPPVKSLKKKIGLSKEVLKKIKQDREIINNIIIGKDPRKLLIIGPCSSDFPDSLIEYAKFLKEISDKVSDKIFIVMRFYTGKPRTIGGWKGLQNSIPGEKANIRTGIETIRKIGKELLNVGLPLADEILHPQIAVYYEDLLSYAAIGSRNTRNQFHREFTSGLDYSVCFKNSMDGDVKIALEGVIASNSKSQYILGSHIYNTLGNKYSHGNLRGGSTGPNYFAKNIIEYIDYAKKNNNNTGFIIDCNHGNSGKDHLKQINILEQVLTSELDIASKKHNNTKELIKGFMVESYIKDGRQDWSEDIEHGLSLTDSCIGLDNTKNLINTMYKLL